jgi:hypothetical protein
MRFRNILSGNTGAIHAPGESVGLRHSIGPFTRGRDCNPRKCDPRRRVRGGSHARNVGPEDRGRRRSRKPRERSITPCCARHPTEREPLSHYTMRTGQMDARSRAGPREFTVSDASAEGEIPNVAMLVIASTDRLEPLRSAGRAPSSEAPQWPPTSSAERENHAMSDQAPDRKGTSISLYNANGTGVRKKLGRSCGTPGFRRLPSTEKSRTPISRESCRSPDRSPMGIARSFAARGFRETIRRPGNRP